MTTPSPTTDLYSVGRAFRRRCRGRRVYPTSVLIGALRGDHQVIDVAAGTDPGLRTDLLERALEQLDPACAVVWITRAGALSPGDLDFAWFAAARTAFGQLGLSLHAFYVITRDGVLDLVSDEVRLWQEVRQAA